MVISTQVYVEHPDLALADTIRSLPEATLGVVSDAGTDPQHDAYFFQIEGADTAAATAALAEDHTVAEFEPVVTAEARGTYRVEYSDDAKLVTPVVNEAGGLTLESESHEDGWLLRLELRDHEALDELDGYARAEGIELEVRELQQAERTGDRTEFGLTEPQVEALVAAFEHGYYEEPREISLAELSSLLGISQTAVSGRLRRGSEHLVETVLLDDGDTSR